MKRYIKLIPAIFITFMVLPSIVGCTGGVAYGGNPFLGTPKFDMVLQFAEGRGYRVEVAKDGTVLVPVRGGLLQRSEDGGQSWDAVALPVGGVPVVDLTNGHVLLLAFPTDGEQLRDNPVDPDDPAKGVWARLGRSTDHGKTWAVEDVVIHQDEKGFIPGSGGAENGITLQYGPKAGRLLMPARVFAGENRSDNYNLAIFSDDGGRTWYPSSPFPGDEGTGEGTLAELSDGRIYYNSRSHTAEDAKRREAWSHDSGETWQDLAISFLPDSSGRRNPVYGCKGGLIRLPLADQDILIYSNVDIPPTDTRRSHITVWASFDGAQTWPVKRLIYGGASGYSMLTAGRLGTPSEGWIYMVFEGGPRGDSHPEPYQGAADTNFARFNLAWILEGTLTGNGDIPADLARKE